VGACAPVGHAALAETSWGAEDATERPWIVGLIVAPDWRRRGLGTELVAVLEDAARAKGWSRLHCATMAGEALLGRRGWTRRGTGPDGQHGIWTIDL
jgi:GNAT superfamily N-acetyltransferase